MRKLAKTFTRIGFALPFLSGPIDLWSNHIDFKKFFTENGGGAALWLEFSLAYDRSSAASWLTFGALG